MFKKIITLATVTIGLGIPLIVNAAPIVYTGADDAVTSLADMTNSSAAAAAFDAAVPGASVIDFESPVPGGVTITGNGSITNNSGCGPLCGINTTVGGDSFLLLSSFTGLATFTFDTAIDSFGMFITGLQTNIVIGQTLTYDDGSTVETIFTPDAINGGGAFIGFVDLGANIVSVTYSANNDIVALDDVRYGRASVPEPGTLTLLGAGLLGLGMLRRRRIRH